MAERKLYKWRRKPGEMWIARGTDPDGRPVYASLATRADGQAEEALAALNARLWKATVYGVEAVTTFEDAVAGYIKDGGDNRFLEKPLFVFKGRLLASIKPAEVWRAADNAYPGRAPTTKRRQFIGPVVAVINFGHEQGWCAPFQMSGRRRRKQQREETVAFPKMPKVAVDAGYVAALRRHCFTRAWPSPYIAAIMLFFHTSGARLSDGLELTPDRLHLDAATPYAECKTKNGKIKRYLLLPALVEELRGLPPRLGLVFGYTRKQGLYRALKKICAEAGLAYLGTHNVGRRSFATTLRRQGWTAEDIAKAGNWDTVRLVQEVYIDPLDQAALDAAALTVMGEIGAGDRPA